MRIFTGGSFIAVLAGFYAVAGQSSQIVSKTMRVDHGRPLIVVSENSVLALEFLKEPIADALVPNADQNVRHCRASYRFRLFNAVTGAITNGEGIVQEAYWRDPVTKIGRDAGSKTGIPAGEFYLWWSEGSAGARSWVYYRVDSPLRFIQQPQQVSYDSIDEPALRRYLTARNVQEFVSAGKRVHVLGPAVFSGDLPSDSPTAAKIESGKVNGNRFELTLSNLQTNKHYIIESSYEAKSSSWTPIHTFFGEKPTQTWSDPLVGNADVTFYRVREGAY